MECRLVLRVSGIPPEPFMLQDEVTSIGRDSDNHIQIVSEGVSRHHARLHNFPSICRLEDLNSTNGTFVNGVRVSEYQLRHGDEVEIGGCVLVFEETVDFDAPGGGAVRREYSARSQNATVKIKGIDDKDLSRKTGPVPPLRHLGLKRKSSS